MCADSHVAALWSCCECRTQVTYVRSSGFRGMSHSLNSIPEMTVKNMAREKLETRALIGTQEAIISPCRTLGTRCRGLTTLRRTAHSTCRCRTRRWSRLTRAIRGTRSPVKASSSSTYDADDWMRVWPLSGPRGALRGHLWLATSARAILSRRSDLISRLIMKNWRRRALAFTSLAAPLAAQKHTSGQHN